MKEAASRNIPAIRVAEETFQKEMSWLKEGIMRIPNCERGAGRHIRSGGDTPEPCGRVALQGHDLGRRPHAAAGAAPGASPNP